MLLYLFDFRKVFFEGASKSSTAFFTVYGTGLKLMILRLRVLVYPTKKFLLVSTQMLFFGDEYGDETI
jgi:hypothetical protein